MDKTVVVAVERRVADPLYKKEMTRTTRCYAHDERNECREGDVVEIVECRPLSRTKRWRVVRILRRARVPLVRRREAMPEEELVLESLEGETQEHSIRPTITETTETGGEAVGPDGGTGS